MSYVIVCDDCNCSRDSLFAEEIYVVRTSFVGFYQVSSVRVPKPDQFTFSFINQLISFCLVYALFIYTNYIIYCIFWKMCKPRRLTALGASTAPQADLCSSSVCIWMTDKMFSFGSAWKMSRLIVLRRKSSWKESQRWIFTENNLTIFHVIGVHCRAAIDWGIIDPRGSAVLENPKQNSFHSLSWLTSFLLNFGSVPTFVLWGHS
jgi:hypothetical protein